MLKLPDRKTCFLFKNIHPVFLSSSCHFFFFFFKYILCRVRTYSVAKLIFFKSAYTVCYIAKCSQVEMEVVLEETQSIYLPFEVLNNIRNVHASQQGLRRVILLKDNHQIKYGFSTIKGRKCTYPLWQGLHVMTNFTSKGLIWLPLKSMAKLSCTFVKNGVGLKVTYHFRTMHCFWQIYCGLF